jgi:outer membrane immunogenic protein
MKKHCVGLLAFTLTSVVALASANAADLSGGGLKDGYVPVNSWSGFYIGANGGYGWNDRGSNVSAFANDGGITNASRGSFDTNGGFGGAQAGRNWQYNRLVLGIEADIQGSAIDGSRSANASADGGDVTATARASSRLDWFGTVRGRAGYAFYNNNALLYATAGLAYGGVRDRLSLTTGGADPGTASFQSTTRDNTEVGVALGGGLEYAFSPIWSLKGEYQYLDLRSPQQLLTVNLGGGNSASATSNIENRYHTVRVGLNYHLSPAYEPLI